MRKINTVTQTFIKVCCDDMQRDLQQIRELITYMHMCYYQLMYELLETFSTYERFITVDTCYIKTNKIIAELSEHSSYANSIPVDTESTNVFIVKYTQDNSQLLRILLDWDDINKGAINRCIKLQNFLLEFPAILLNEENTAEYLIECRDNYDSAIEQIMARLSNLNL